MEREGGWRGRERERGERGGERERGGRERGRERGREGGERGGERKFIFINHFFGPYNLIMGEFFSSSILPQLQDRGSLLFLIIYMKKLLSSDWLR